MVVELGDTSTMKHRLSVTLDEDVVLGIMGMLRDPRFSNKSQIVEFAVKSFLQQNDHLPN